MLTPLANGPDRYKRSADDAMGGAEQSSKPFPRQTMAGYDHPPKDAALPHEREDTRVMARMLGLEVPGMQSTTSYFPGYEWWPSMQIQPQQAMPPPQHMRPGVPLPPMVIPPHPQHSHHQQQSPVGPSPTHAWMPTSTSQSAYNGYGSVPGYSYDPR
jgi:hypothetical protein